VSTTTEDGSISLQEMNADASSDLRQTASKRVLRILRFTIDRPAEGAFEKGGPASSPSKDSRNDDHRHSLRPEQRRRVTTAADSATFDQLGYYAVAFQIFTLLNFLPSSALAVAYPRLVKLHQVDPRRYLEILRKIYVAVTLGGMLIFVGIWLWVTPAIGFVFGAQSTPAGPVAVMMALANVFTFSGTVRYQVIYIEHKPVYHVYNTLLGFVVLIPLNLLFIPKYGAVGAAAGVACACFAANVVSSWVFAPLRATGIDQMLAFLGLRRRLGSALS